MLDGESLRKIRREYLDVDDPEEKRKRIAHLLKKMELSSMNFIYKLERGESNARVETLFKLAEALECEPWELVSSELLNSLMPDKVWDKIVYGNFYNYLSETDREAIPERYKKLIDNEKLVKDLGGKVHTIEVSRTAGESENGCPKPPRGFPTKKEIELPFTDCEALEVVDDSLDPFYQKGNILVVSHEYRNWKNGDVCEASAYDERYLRKVFHDKDADVFTFQPLSSRYPVEIVSGDDVDWIYKVIATIL